MKPPSWLIELPTCPSTNTWALEHSEALAHGACVYTQHQTAGRGQPGNQWRSPPGVLTASFVVAVPPQIQIGALSLCTGLAVAHTVEDLAPRVQVQIKWPNDCLIDERKLAGILCEQSERKSSPDRTVVIGIGLNLDPRWDQAPETLPLAADRRWAPISVAEVAAIIPSPLTTLVTLRQYVLEAVGVLGHGGWSRLLPEIAKRDWLAGHTIHCDATTGPLSGQACGIDTEARLLLRNEQGIHAVTSARAISRLD